MACSISLHRIHFLHFPLKPLSGSLFSSTAALTPRMPLLSSPSSARSTNGGVGFNRSKQMLSASASLSDDLRPALGENPEGIISGEWPENFSLLSFDDLRAYLETQIISEKTKSSATLDTVMSTKIRTAKPEQTLEEIDHNFEVVSGLPVVDDELRCIGVISKKDKARAHNGVCFFHIFIRFFSFSSSFTCNLKSLIDRFRSDLSSNVLWLLMSDRSRQSSP
ncbi:hypothetical protein B296_00021196 [Ensete ventricosum]|uniref:CBS domain-containing protein n=1 Tax=Ensete ventricosum TaxID=4639 RepID=A0A426YMY3_ENSVE|nr:hypothetical protein B296_00021196 [Ensete ventricosum]